MSSGNLKIIKYGIANGISNLSCLNMLNRIQHIVCINFYAVFLLEGKRRRNSLRNALARDNRYAAFPFKKIACLLGGKYDIRVIWQYENMLCRNRMNRFYKILCAWIHGLSAGENNVYTEACKNFRDALAGCNSDKSIRCKLISRQKRRFYRTGRLSRNISEQFRHRSCIHSRY
ncbi:hypothetical protein D3C73_1141790 [compost metagenome]